MAGARREQHELFDSHCLDWLWDSELEVTPEVAHGFTLHVFDEGSVARDLHVQLVIFEEAACSVRPGEVQPLPLKMRRSASTSCIERSSMRFSRAERSPERGGSLSD